MKKTKLLTVLGVCLAMGLTACGGAKSSDDVSSQDTPATSQKSDDTSAHTHKYGDWKQTKAPTCTEKGEEEAVCECGEKKTREVAALGHDFDNGTVLSDTSTCTEDGKITVKCARCDATKEIDAKAHHKFGEEAKVDKKGEGYVDYSKAVCSVDNAIQIKIRALDGTLASGSSIKDGTSEGYFKLAGNNQSISWKFNLPISDENDGAIGMAYTRGFMDYWSSNTEKQYGVYSTSHNNIRAEGNFDFTVNGSKVDKSAYMEKTFEELTAGGEDSSSVGENFSPIALVPVGQVVLNKGDNTIEYKRTGSYNLVISDIVLIVNEFKHTHTAAADWSSDENQHWHLCTAPGCPVEGGYKMDAADHTFGEKYDEVAATCAVEGSYKQKCSVCGFEKVVKVEKVAHTYGEPYDVVAATCEAAGSQKRKCSVCEDVITEVLPKLAHTYGDVVENYAAGEGYIASSAYNCSVCNKSALRWSALDYDATDSSTGLDKQSTYVRFASGAVENKDGVEGAGSHIIYKINVSAAVAKAGLSFKIKNTSGSGWGANVVAPVFKTIDGDSALGAIKNADGTFTTATHRYGLKVNGVEYLLGDDSYGNQSGVTAWFDWPVEFPLVAGVNTIDVFAYAGYRAQLMEFQVTGLPFVTPSHVHNGDDAWLNDETNHWHKCSAEGCPIEDGIYDKAAHTFGAKYDEMPATCTSKGSYKQACTVCGYVKTVEVAQLDHTLVDGTAKKNSDEFEVTPFECSACNKVGAKMAVDSFTGNTKTGSSYKFDNNTTVTYKMIAPKAGNYQLKIGAFVANNRTKTLATTPYTVKLGKGDAAVDVPVSSGTYEELGIGTSSAKQFVLCPTITLVEGENIISLTQGAGGYRLTFQGLVEIYEL